MSMFPFLLWKVAHPAPLSFPFPYDRGVWIRRTEQLEERLDALKSKFCFNGNIHCFFVRNPASIWHAPTSPEELSPDILWDLMNRSMLSIVDVLAATLLASDHDVYRFNAVVTPFDDDVGFVASPDFEEYWLSCPHQRRTAMEWLDDGLMGVHETDATIYELVAPKTPQEKSALMARLGLNG